MEIIQSLYNHHRNKNKTAIEDLVKKKTLRFLKEAILKLLVTKIKIVGFPPSVQDFFVI